LAKASAELIKQAFGLITISPALAARAESNHSPQLPEHKAHYDCLKATENVNMKSILLATTAAVAMTAHCQAADIRFIPPSTSTSTAPTIVIAGTLVSGDFAKFSTYADIITAGTKVFVTLDSSGGLVAEGLNIGEAIAHRGFATVANHKCLSACALTWLAGARRAVYPNTHIGFHAAYRSYDMQESGVANALVGSYLTKLGFP
jgi:hypothetical protein